MLAKKISILMLALCAMLSSLEVSARDKKIHDTQAALKKKNITRKKERVLQRQSLMQQLLLNQVRIA